MTILVLGGGNGSERGVSLRSSAAVREALHELGHTVTAGDPRDGEAAVVAAARAADLVFPILHGVGGEDGTVQRWLDAAGRPYLGSDAAASELCFNKQRLLDRAARHGIAVPAGGVVTRAEFAASELKDAPFVLKPVADGSTIGCLIVRSMPYDQRRVRELFKQYGQMILEELVEGIELTVPVLGDKALPVIEIIPPAGQEFDFDNKYNGATAELCPPQHVPAEAQHRAQQLAENVHQLAGCRHLSRTDMILRPDGQLVLLEINTLPGLTNQSLYPRSANVAGLSFGQLIDRFVAMLRETVTLS
ncbi:MAG TPA: D-alanine--D-alanine ligase [Candidatus Saccharimonadia bacterium]